MASESKNSAGGIGFLGLLGLLFIGLKLADVIQWSWWLVLLPLYGPLAAAVVVVCGLVCVALGCAITAEVYRRNFGGK